MVRATTKILNTTLLTFPLGRRAKPRGPSRTWCGCFESYCLANVVSRYGENLSVLGCGLGPFRYTFRWSFFCLFF